MTIRKTLLLFCFTFFLLLAMMPAPASAATPIQAWGSAQDIKTGGTSPTATLTSCATNQAYFIVAFVTLNGSDATLLTISSTSIPSGSWHHGPNVASNSGSQSAIWYAYSASISDSETVTATGSYVFYTSITAQCYSGVKTVSQADQSTNHVCGTGATNINSCNTGSITPVQGGELIVAAQYGAATATVDVPAVPARQRRDR